MPYDARVFKVMITSPSDVGAERVIARELVYEWNDLYSEERGIVLLPVSWETHANPSMAAAAQEVINRQVLEGCDLLIGIFWTRLGTPTANALSGSVEEIERHLSAGGHAMLYFSDTPVVYSSVDRDQYDALQRFREQCRGRGLIESYSSLDDFREKLRRHLVQFVIRNLQGTVTSPPASSRGSLGPTRPQTGLLLSREAMTLLYHGAQDKNATIARRRYFGGALVMANRQQWPRKDEEKNPRKEVAWWSAVDELQALGLIQDRGNKGEVFQLTPEGFRVAETLTPPPDAESASGT